MCLKGLPEHRSTHGFLDFAVMPYLLLPAPERAGNVKLHVGNCLHLRSETLHDLFSLPRHIRATPAVPKPWAMTWVGN